MNVYRFPYVSKPFKGNHSYEIQVGPIVVQWWHAHDVKRQKFHIGPLSLRNDITWRKEIVRRWKSK